MSFLAQCPEALPNVNAWHYGFFILGVLIALALDLGIFHRKPQRVSFREALCWSTLWFSISMAFAFFTIPGLYGPEFADAKRIEFITGYILELSLSMDNVFVIALIFTFFKVKPKYQHRVLFLAKGSAAVRSQKMGFKKRFPRIGAKLTYLEQKARAWGKKRRAKKKSKM